MKVSEPAIAYNTPYLQGLKNRLITAIDESRDEKKLQECLELLYADNMPCVFTDEEFKRELEESEASGNASDEEVKAMFAKWRL
jgi:hypothetical protein